MDDLLREFLTETAESLDVVDVELVKFEQEPNNDKILGNIFRLVHTIKGTCGFLGLPRLEAVAHAAETLMGRFRDGAPVTSEAVSLVLVSIDRIKSIVAELERLETEPEGEDSDIISKLEVMSEAAKAAMNGGAPPAAAPKVEEPALQVQTLERELRPGEVSLDELERAFRETAVEEEKPAPKAAPAKAKPAAAAADKADKGDGDESLVKNQSIRVNVDTLEHLMTMVSELVLTRNQLMEISRRMEDSDFKVPLQRLSNVTAELQDGVMKTRMQPIGNAWQKLPRIVRDLARELGKTIDLQMHGAETELDRQVLELIKDPLTHMVRNSADHGLEGTSDRRALGKSETGIIKLSAFHEGGHIIIEISDDGKGLDVARIKKKVLENGLATEAELEKMSEQQICKFIFAPGFSTAAAVTSVSGRGVGMDVVKTNIDQIGGTIDLKTTQGEGTTFTIKIPLTLAIVSALIVESSGERFAIPQISVVELVRATSNGEHKIEMIKNTPVLRLRNKLLPLIHLKNVLNMSAQQSNTEEGFVVVTQVGSRTFGIVVDGVFHTEEIVVKPMSSKLRHINMFSGNTILGDGSVIMIIDPNGISKQFGAANDTSQDEAEATHAQRSADDKRMSFLVFRAGHEGPKAVPLSLVTRLEEIDVSKIEEANDRSLVQYRGSLMPLVYVGQTQKRTEGVQPLLVFSDEGRSMGLAVDEIVDIVEDDFDVEIVSDNPSIVGTAVIKGKATDVIDVAHFLPQAFEDWFMRKEITKSGPQRLVFVDDSAFFRNMLTPVLKAAGYEVKVFSSAQEALSALKKEGARADVVVSDIEMPQMDGFAFAEALRSDDRYKKVPLIGLSTVASEAVVERGQVAGFQDYVAKFDRQGLISALKDVSARKVVA